MGSILVMAGQVLFHAFQSSFSVLVGPINHITYLVSKERLPILAVCFSSLARTLYFALGISTGTIPRLPTYMTFVLHRRNPSLARCWQASSMSVAHPMVFSDHADPRLRSLWCLRTSIFPRWYTDAPFRRTNRPARHRQPSPSVIYSFDTVLMGSSSLLVIYPVFFLRAILFPHSAGHSDTNQREERYLAC